MLLLSPVALVALALSLRVGLGSAGSLMPTIHDALGMSGSTVTALAAIPALAFSLLGFAGGPIILRSGVHPVVVAVALVVAGSLGLRAMTGEAPVFLLTTAIIMGGCAIGNVALPVLVKTHFPAHLIGATGVYGAAVALSAAAASLATAPAAERFSSWHLALGMWAVVPVTAGLLWLPWAIRDARSSAPRAGSGAGSPTDAPTLLAIARTPVAWCLALCFGAQAGQAYVQFGYWAELTEARGGTEAHAGALLAVINGAVVPVALAMPLLMRWAGRSAALPITFAGLTVAGYAGALLDSDFLGGWLWASVLGAGGGAFTWVFAMVGRKTESPAATAQLSAFAQGAGYLLATSVTVLFGWVHGVSGTWSVPLLMTMGIATGIACFGWAATKCASVEACLPQVEWRNEGEPRSSAA